MDKLQALQNGSDIRGIAISTDEAAANLTAVEASAIANGIVDWLQQHHATDGQQLRIAVGHDSRLSGPTLKQALIDTFLTHSVEVLDTGMATTPAMFMATQFEAFDCDAGIMITASHLPYHYNGIKLFSRKGGAEHEDIAYILAHSYPLDRSLPVVGQVQTADVIPVYAQDMVRKIQRATGEEKPLASFHIVLDAGNGAGGFFAEKVLQELGADTTGSQFLEPDGTFPNHIPNPDNKEAMASIQRAVLTQGADLGVIFDTDVDRAAVVDRNGEALNRNNLIAVLATIVLEEHPGTAIVTNSPTSSHLKTFISQLGGKQVRYLSGYRNVINKAISLNEQGVDTQLAIETSGHAAFKENYFLDDGAYVIAKILMLLPKLKKQGRQLSDLIADLKQPAETQEVRFPIAGSDYRAYGEQVIQQMAVFADDHADFSMDDDNEEGVRVTVRGEYGSGWYLLRMSLHEPLLVLQAENDVKTKNSAVLHELQPFFGAYDRLDTSKLTAVLNKA